MTLPIAALHLIHVSIFHPSFFLSFDRQLSGPIDKEVSLFLTSLWAGPFVALPLRERERQRAIEGVGLFVCMLQEVTNTPTHTHSLLVPSANPQSFLDLCYLRVTSRNAP